MVEQCSHKPINVFTADANIKPVKVEDFAEYLAALQSNMNKQFRADYESLASGTEYTFHASRVDVNMNKNRYKNVLPCKSVYFAYLEFYQNCLISR